MPTTLITSAGSAVKVINAGVGAGVYWVVGSSATIAAGSTFLGNLLTTTSITMNERANIACVDSVGCAGGLDVPDDGSAPAALAPANSSGTSGGWQRQLRAAV